jgi:hypothetical protein
MAGIYTPKTLEDGHIATWFKGVKPTFGVNPGEPDPYSGLSGYTDLLADELLPKTHQLG